MSRSIVWMSACAGLAVGLVGISGEARAQSFNIEVNNGAITAVSSTFGAAGLPGAWNSYNSASPATIPLVKLDGSAATATFTRSLISNYATATTSNTGDYKAVVDDYQFVSGATQMTMSFNNLEPGVYMVILYNAAPSTAHTASYWSPEQTSPSWNYGGGTAGANTFKPLRTHNYMVCQTNAGNDITIKVQAAAGEARLSAIQLVKLDSDWRVYVNTPTRGNQAGTSWTTAMGDLQDALNIARVLEDRCEIWVGSGTYKPTATTDRSLSFDVPPGTSIYGGFTGGETSLSERSGLPADETILSGEIGMAIWQDNTRTVVKVNFAGNKPVTLDGLTIADGYGIAGDVVAGLLVESSTVNLTDVGIKHNRTDTAGGMYVRNSSVNLSGVVFSENATTSTPIGAAGALMLASGSSLSTVYADRCQFIRNSGFGGVAIYNDRQRVYLTNSLLTGNTTTLDSDSAPIHSVGSSSATSIWGSTLAYNGGGYSGGVYLEDGANVTVTNSIFWGNDCYAIQYPVVFDNFSREFTYSVYDVQYSTLASPGLAGTGNNTLNPMFVAGVGADGVAGTADDDYRLSPGSPALDSGSIPLFSFNNLDLDGLPRFVDLPSVPNTAVDPIFGGGYADRGCYERSIPSCPADFDESGFVDSDDFVMYISHFALGCTGPGQGAMGAEPACVKSADFDQSGFVDSDDFVAFNTAFETPCNP